ncbi:hypothetical protein EMIT0P258_20251 [Pseudomonas sp. IT-P258]
MIRSDLHSHCKVNASNLLLGRKDDMRSIRLVDIWVLMGYLKLNIRRLIAIHYVLVDMR